MRPGKTKFLTTFQMPIHPPLVPTSQQQSGAYLALIFCILKSSVLTDGHLVALQMDKKIAYQEK